VNRVLASLIAVVVGAAAGAAAWLLLVPWDLSEFDASGRMIESGGDDNAGRIAVVAAVLLAAGVGLAFVDRARRQAPAATFGGFAAWAVLFAWRAGSARVSGANFFIIPLVVVVIPTAVIVPLLIRWVAWRGGRGREGRT